MIHLPTNVPPFSNANTSEPLPGCLALLGVGWDGTASFRDGAREAPDAIRAVSFEGMESYSPIQDRDLDAIRYADLGNLALESSDPGTVVSKIREMTMELLDKGVIPLILGGDHSVSPGAIQAAYDMHPDLGVIQFDAHADLRETWDGTPHSHACTMRRVLDYLPGNQLLQVGIRSGSREEFAELRREDRLVPPDPDSLHQAILARGFDQRPLYVTFDVDIFDPSLLPGTGTPEAGGIDWPTFESLRAAIPCDKVVAMDVVELSPSIDPSGNSAIVAAKLLREWILAISPFPSSGGAD